MDLPTAWYLLIAALFVGYFVLEGFDFGVGALLPVLGRDDRERRVLINTIGPVWDGNEVWLITAGGALFAAFPEWYATLFSGFYAPLLLILLALIARGVAFEYRGKRTDPRWRARWDAAIVVGSLVPAFGWGLVFATLLRGVPLNADHDFVGTTLDLFSPYALLGGATTLALFVAHGAMFLALKTTRDIRARAARIAVRAATAALALAAPFLAWTLAQSSTLPGAPPADATTRDGLAPAAVALAIVAAGALAAALAAARARREGWAFTGTATAIAATVATLFAARHPVLLPSTLDPAGTLTVANASATAYTLRIMTWAAALCAPVVVAYQAWSYWVFRRRVDIRHIPE
ncbi:cytochrome d ubiquinol oxidase subunit II [Rhizomonospora bruguierae]|uniref:cytochrome d ubiquinol oxidase subunit II n=1 Tax=Rhizomonospora bruguierae TaxID=1581705 RepID=UPI001BCFCBEF|nr:cytochrome d ubiquinol oxidase subunit II [Micromonospora sp. NBRC 107566]